MNNQEIFKYTLITSVIILVIYFIYRSVKKITEKFSYGMAFGGDAEEYQKQFEENTNHYIQGADTAETLDPEVLVIKAHEQELINRSKMLSPSELLPTGTDDYALVGKNFLASSFDHGMDTRGASMKNPNLQLRSDPPIPRNEKLSPFNQSTVEQDNIRKVVEF